MQAIRQLGAATVLALVCASVCGAADRFEWDSKLEDAKQNALRTNRLVLIHFEAPWNDRCQLIERDIFSRPGFGRELDANFVGVKLQFDYYPATARQYGVQAVPTDVIITAKGQLVDRFESPTTEAEYIAAMNRVAVYARTGQRPPVGSDAAPGAAPIGAAPTAAAVAAPAAPAPDAAAQAVASPTKANDTYMDYYQRQRAEKQTVNTAPYAQVAAAAPQAPATQPSNWASTPQATAPPAGTTVLSTQQAPVAQPPRYQTPVAANVAPPASAAPAQPNPATRGVPQIAPTNSPLGMDGHCLITLYDKREWKMGDPRFGMQHRGRTYLFAGPAEMQRFQADPDRYAPVLGGNDPVLQLDHGQSTPGSRLYGLFCDGHVYLFASELTLQRFMANQMRYTATAVQQSPTRR